MACDKNKLFEDDLEILNYRCDIKDILFHHNNHIVLYQLPINSSFRPHVSLLKWDGDHVRMPCSIESKYPTLVGGNQKKLELRWHLIQEKLSTKFTSSYELEKAIKSYNSRYEHVWKFDAFHEYVKQMDQQQRNQFFNETLPAIISLALRLDQVIQCPIPLLKRGMTKSISMSQEQAASLLANAFLCTFPRRNSTQKNTEYSTYPNINFNSLFSGHGQNTIEKIKCIVNYFQRVTTSIPSGAITFARQSPPRFPDWQSESGKSFSSIKYAITARFRIEDAQEMLQVDFANKKIGGGVLGNGCIQEEIRFCINPELIVARLFTEFLDDHEAVVITGTTRYSQYVGYAADFRFAGNFVDPTGYDENGRRKTQIVAIDALRYRSTQEEFREQTLTRELNKAYAGFYREMDASNQPVATGFWGCGAFGGHLIKSAVIQLMACRLARRNLLFFTFNDQELKIMIEQLFQCIVHSGVSVARLFMALKKFNPPNMNNPEHLVLHIKNEISGPSSSSVVQEIVKPLKMSLPSSSKSQPVVPATINLASDSTPQKLNIQYPRFDPTKFSEEEDKNRFHSIKHYFSSSAVKNDIKKNQEKSSGLLNALDDEFYSK